MIQQNVPPFVKWTTAYKDSNFVIHEKKSVEAMRSEPDIIIWPETATSNYLRYVGKHLRRIRFFINEYNVSLLTGALDSATIDGKRRVFNSAFLFEPGAFKLQAYNKLKLVPFSEKIPFDDKFPFLAKYNFGGGGFYPGEEHSVLSFKLTQALVSQADELLLTNDDFEIETENLRS